MDRAKLLNSRQANWAPLDDQVRRENANEHNDNDDEEKGKRKQKNDEDNDNDDANDENDDDEDDARDSDSDSDHPSSSTTRLFTSGGSGLEKPPHSKNKFSKSSKNRIMLEMDQHSSSKTKGPKKSSASAASAAAMRRRTHTSFSSSAGAAAAASATTSFKRRRCSTSAGGAAHLSDHALDRKRLNLRNRIIVSSATWGFLTGIERAIIIPTLWLYLSNYMEPVNEAGTYYGVTLSAFNLSVFLFSPIYGLLAHYGFSSKLLLLVSNQIEIIGNVIYFLASPRAYLVLLGRFLAGIGAGSEVPVYADLVKVSKRHERTRCIILLMLARQFGLIFGPGLTLLLYQTTYRIGSLDVTVYNSPGFLMAALWAVHSLILVFVYPTTQQLRSVIGLINARQQQQKQQSHTHAENDKQLSGDRAGDAAAAGAGDDMEMEIEMEQEKLRVDSGNEEVDALISSSSAAVGGDCIGGAGCAGGGDEIEGGVRSSSSSPHSSSSSLSLNSMNNSTQNLLNQNDKQHHHHHHNHNHHHYNHSSNHHHNHHRSHSRSRNPAHSSSLMSSSGGASGSGAVPHASFSGYLSSLCSYAKLTTLFMVFTGYFCVMSLESVLPPMAFHYFGWTEVETSWVYLACGIEIIVACVCWQKAAKWLSDRNFLVIGYGILTLCYLLLTVLTSIIYSEYSKLLLLHQNSPNAAAAASKAVSFSSNISAASSTTGGAVAAGTTMAAAFHVELPSKLAYIVVLLIGIFLHVVGLSMTIGAGESIFTKLACEQNEEKGQTLLRTVANFSFLAGPLVGGFLESHAHISMAVQLAFVAPSFLFIIFRYRAFKI